MRSRIRDTGGVHDARVVWACLGVDPRPAAGGGRGPDADHAASFTVGTPTPEAKPTFDTKALYECDGIPRWVTAVALAAPHDLSAEEQRVLDKWTNDELTYDTARPSEAHIMSDILDAYVGRAWRRFPDVPYAVEDFHEARFASTAIGRADTTPWRTGTCSRPAFNTAEESEIDTEWDRAVGLRQPRVRRGAEKAWGD